MKLPKQIQDEIDEAEAIERMIAGEVETPPVEETPPEAEAPVTEADTLADQSEVPVQDDPNSETWEQRYRVLQGKYDRDVPVLHAQVRELTEQLQQVSQKLQTTPPPAPQSEVSQEDIDTFGEDLVKLAQRIAAAEADRRVAEAMQRVNQVEGKIHQSDEERFYSGLTQRVPHWKDVDNDPGWISWLGNYDPMVGGTRQEALNAAAQSLDANRVASIFESYMLTRQQVSQPVPPAPQVSTIQQQVVPRSQGAPVSSQQKRIYTQAEIARLLDPRHILHLPEDQQRAIERDIDLAVVEGRIAA